VGAPLQDTITLRAELVVVDANVVDKRSREFIRGLKPQDFELFEDNARQRIEFLSQDHLPLSIVLLVDISPSVRPVIERVREGALQALQRLKPEDEVALMAFSGRTELIQDFTKERQLILDKLGEALDRKGGGTRIHEAIAKAARQMRYATSPRSRRVIIAITDNQGSMDRYRDAISEEEVRQTVTESGATVCGIIVRSLLNVADAILFQHPIIQERSKRTSINPYVEQTGGEMAGASKDEINARLGEMLDHLRRRYTLGYSSTNQNYDGKFRRITLRLSPEARKRLGGEIAISARQGYYAVDKESEKLLADDTAPEQKNPGSKGQAAAGGAGSAPGPANPNESKSVDRVQPQPSVPIQPMPVEAPSPYAHLVMLDVQAVNKKTGAAADNLAKEDLELLDNGSKREIEK
jgi:VWFA-related protein